MRRDINALNSRPFRDAHEIEHLMLVALRGSPTVSSILSFPVLSCLSLVGRQGICMQSGLLVVRTIRFEHVRSCRIILPNDCLNPNPFPRPQLQFCDTICIPKCSRTQGVHFRSAIRRDVSILEFRESTVACSA